MPLSDWRTADQDALNLLVLEHVLGWQWWSVHDGYDVISGYKGTFRWLDKGQPHLPYKIAAGWEHHLQIKPHPSPATQWDDLPLVIEKLRSEGWLVNMRAMPAGIPFLYGEEQVMREAYAGLDYMGERWPRSTEDCRKRIWRPHLMAVADTVPEAVCKVALQLREWEAKETE